MSNFVPEMHDIGKLIPKTPNIPTTDGKPLESHDQDGPSFRNLDWNTIQEEPPTNATWLAVVYHIDKKTEWVRDLSKPLPVGVNISDEDRVRLFLTVLSDHLAATSGRVLKEGGTGESPKTYRLWRPSFSDELKADPEPIRDEATLKQALALIRSSPPDMSDFAKIYGESLHGRGEDEGIPRNVTSLYSHSLLSGKFYRVLADVVEVLENPLRVSLNNCEATAVHDAEMQWKSQLVRAVVHFHQSPVRPADLGVFVRLQEKADEFRRQAGDHLLFSTSDTFWLFYVGDSRLDDTVFAPLTEGGFYVITEIQAVVLSSLGVWQEAKTQQTMQAAMHVAWNKRLAELTTEITAAQQEVSSLDSQIAAVTQKLQSATSPASRKIYGEQRGTKMREHKNADIRLQSLAQEQTAIQAQLSTGTIATSKTVTLAPQNFYPSLISPVDPPLCEICQMRHAQAYAFGTTTDYLCDICLDLRQSVGFNQRWLGEKSEGQIVWARVALDASRLESGVALLFASYLDSLKRKDGKPLDDGTRLTMKTEMRLPALLRDFVGDYQILLTAFEIRLKDIIGKDFQERLGVDAWVAFTRRGSQLYELLNAYRQLAKQYFPTLTEASAPDSPLRFGISIAPAKYPFYQHWRYVSEPPAAVSARIVGKEPLEVSLYAATLLVEKLSDLNGPDWAARDWRTYLHKLSAIAARSGSHALATTTFISDLDVRQRGVPRNLSEFKEPLRKRILRVSDLLAYAKVTAWR